MVEVNDAYKHDRYEKNLVEQFMQGKRKVGHQKQTWRRSTDAEIKAAGTTWTELKRTNQNRVRWRGVVAALCCTRNQEAYVK